MKCVFKRPKHKGQVTLVIDGCWVVDDVALPQIIEIVETGSLRRARSMMKQQSVKVMMQFMEVRREWKAVPRPSSSSRPLTTLEGGGALHA